MTLHTAHFPFKLLAIFTFLINTQFLRAQITDTLTLKSFEIESYKLEVPELIELKPIHNTYILSGRKTEVIDVKDLPANLAEKTGRQLFAKIPGAFVYDMDGSGNQMNISTRGLDPHRSWEYNIRQNGVMTNSDIFGYPASHYSPPMEAIDRIELFRGTSSIQYGSQFGGMINYIIKSPDTTTAISAESINTVGSYGLLSSFTALGGKIGKLTYYAYYQRRVSDGYRDNANSDSQAQFISLNYAFTKKFNAKFELGRSTYLFQIPGALTDSMFVANPRQSTRSRNFFNPDIYLPSLTLNWKMNERTQFNWVTSAVIGHRSSVQKPGFANQPDLIDSTTLQYNNRQVDIDKYNNYTSELRFQKEYNLIGISATIVTGVRYMNNDTYRTQQGVGTTGTNYDLTLVSPIFGRDVHLRTQSVAGFAENLFKISKKLHVSIGARYEWAESRFDGQISYIPTDDVPKVITYNIPVFGISGQYNLNPQNKIYGGWSQAYRPVIFADLMPATPIDRTDPNLSNSNGHNIELGVKGKLFGFLDYDLSFFQVLYQNRVGSLILTDENNEDYVLKTNTGDSQTNGIELFAEVRIIDLEKMRLSVFTASSYMNGRYTKGNLRKGDVNIDITGNKLETVPEIISRNGIQFAFKKFTSIAQFSYVSDSFSDAFNTVEPSANGGAGIVPAYYLVDLNVSYRFNKMFALRGGVNNVLNHQYFTKRPSGYPGPGVWSSDGRTLNFTFSIKI